MHEMLTILTDDRGVCLSVSLSVTRLKSSSARAVYAACRVHGVIRDGLRQVSVASCFFSWNAVFPNRAITAFHTLPVSSTKLYFTGTLVA